MSVGEGGCLGCCRGEEEKEREKEREKEGEKEGEGGTGEEERRKSVSLTYRSVIKVLYVGVCGG